MSFSEFCDILVAITILAQLMTFKGKNDTQKVVVQYRKPHMLLIVIPMGGCPVAQTSDIFLGS